MGDRPRLAISDLSPIETDRRDHLRGTAGQEAFVGHKQVVPRQGYLVCRQPVLLGEFEHGVACNPLQDPRVDRWREQLPSFDDEDIIARAFGDFALVVEHHGFDASGPQALDFGQDVIQVIQRLDPRIERCGVIADRRGGDQVEPVPVVGFGIEGNPIGDDDDLRIFAAERVEPELISPAGND